jgi:hypothetical protein
MDDWEKSPFRTLVEAMRRPMRRRSMRDYRTGEYELLDTLKQAARRTTMH